MDIVILWIGLQTTNSDYKDKAKWNQMNVFVCTFSFVFKYVLNHEPMWYVVKQSDGNLLETEILNLKYSKINENTHSQVMTLFGKFIFAGGIAWPNPT